MFARLFVSSVCECVVCDLLCDAMWLVRSCVCVFV